MPIKTLSQLPGPTGSLSLEDILFGSRHSLDGSYTSSKFSIQDIQDVVGGSSESSSYSNTAVTASYMTGSVIFDSNTIYPLTASVSVNALTASFIGNVPTSSYSFTSSILSLNGNNASIDSTGSFKNNGRILFNSGSQTVPGLAAIGDDNTGIYYPSADTIAFVVSGSEYLRIQNGAAIRTLTDIAFGASSDVNLTRDGADQFALRRSVNSQSFAVYNTRTDSANWERGTVGWFNNAFILGTSQLGSGLSRAIQVWNSGSLRWTFSTSGHFTAGTDNSYDIGLNGSARPRNVYAASAVYSPVISASAFSQQQGTLTNSASILLDFGGTTVANSLTATGSIQFTSSNLAAGRNYRIAITGGGTNSSVSFPAWKFLTVQPTIFTAGKSSMLSLESWGTTDANVYAWFQEQA